MQVDKVCKQVYKKRTHAVMLHNKTATKVCHINLNTIEQHLPAFKDILGTLMRFQSN